MWSKSVPPLPSNIRFYNALRRHSKMNTRPLAAQPSINFAIHVTRSPLSRRLTSFQKGRDFSAQSRISRVLFYLGEEGGGGGERLFAAFLVAFDWRKRKRRFVLTLIFFSFLIHSRKLIFGIEKLECFFFIFSRWNCNKGEMVLRKRKRE